jgi:Sulfotransferase family
MDQDPAPPVAPDRLRTRLKRTAWRTAWLAEGRLPGRRPGPLAPWTAPAVSLPPILIGGTGRSGTSITARLLGRHPAYHALPFEVRFLAASGGLCDLVDGRTSVMAFERKLLGLWYERVEGRGLHQITDRETIRAAVRELDAGLATDPLGAARRFAHRLLDAPAVAAGKAGWLEDTPSTMRTASRLATILPEARFVHLVRDGRDVAASVLRRSWGPDEALEGLRWWASNLDRSFAQAAAVPGDRVLTVRMEALFRTDREATYRRLLAFLDLDDEPPLRAFFDDDAPAGRAHLGRWRRDIPEADRPAFEALYRELAGPLQARWGYEMDLVDAELDRPGPSAGSGASPGGEGQGPR